MSRIGNIKSLLEQLYNGEWHSQSSLYAKGFGAELVWAACDKGLAEVRDDDDKHDDWFRITQTGKQLLN